VKSSHRLSQGCTLLGGIVEVLTAGLGLLPNLATAVRERFYVF